MVLAVFGISWITPYSFLTPHKSSWLTRTLPASAQAPVVQLPQASLASRLPKESSQQMAA